MKFGVIQVIKKTHRSDKLSEGRVPFPWTKMICHCNVVIKKKNKWIDVKRTKWNRNHQVNMNLYYVT